MASRFWVGGSASWDATAGAKWATVSGGAGGASVPTAADDVFFDAASGAVTVTAVSGQAVAANLTCTGFTGTLTGATISTGGNVILGAGMNAASMLLLMGATGGSTRTLTSNGKTLSAFTINAATTGTVALADALSVSGAVTLTTGIFDTTSKSVTAGSFASSNSNTRTLTLGSSTITLSAVGTAWTTVNASGLTFSGAAASIVLNGSAQLLSTPSTGHTFGSVTWTNASNLSSTGPFTATNVSITGPASKTGVFQLNANVTVTGTLTINGNSATNRLLVQTNVLGTPRTITAAAVVASNVDLVDITGAGAASWNLSAIAGGSGDLGGNSGITFTASTTQTHTATAGGNWSDATKWSSRVPLPQDDVVVDVATTGTLTLDMPRAGRSLNFSGFAGTLSVGVAFSIFGSLTFSSGMTYTNGTGFVLTIGGRAAYTITTAGKTLPNAVTLAAPGGTYTLADALVSTGASGVIIASGTLDTNGQSVTAPRFQNTGSTTKAVTLGTSTVTITTTATGNAFDLSAPAMTVSAAAATIVFAAASVSRTFLGGGFAYGTLTYTAADSPGALVITGSNTFGTLNVGSGRSLQLTAGTTQTVTTWNVNGESRDYVYLPAVSGAYVSTPDANDLDITGDIEIIVRASATAWSTPGQTFVSKFGNAPTRSYGFRIHSTVGKRLEFLFTQDGSTAITANSGANLVPFADGTAGWMRVTRTAASGVVRFYTATTSGLPGPADWVQLGPDVATTAGAMFSSTAPLGLGADLVGASNFLLGRIHRAIVRDGIGGTTVADFDASKKSPTADTYTGTSGKVWTLNGQSKQGDGRVTLESSSAGSSASVSTPNPLHAKYLTLQDITGAGVGVKNARRSRIVSNVTGWNVALSAKLYRSGGVFRVKPHRTKIGGVMVEKLDKARVGGVMVP